LYRAVDSAREPIEFMLSPKRDLIAPKLFLLSHDPAADLGCG
jgi:transposase-like protein